jgi:F-box protein 9
VDQKYKNKHFPPTTLPAKPIDPNPSNGSATVPSAAHASLDGPPQSYSQLIASFSELMIEPVLPPVEGTEAPPCPIASLPQEILVQICKDVAILDVASFAHLGLVCKRLAYLIATEEPIWKRVCEGSEVGFGAMHYDWQREVLGGPLEIDFTELLENLEEVPGVIEVVRPIRETITDALFRGVYRSSWLQMFRLRPRIRFNGCYISTNNYIRPGQGSTNLVTWNNPVHIVTYYRYVRFYRDGTLISLLTTAEPVDVVRYLTKENLELHANKANLHLPSIVMQHGLRGRWRLTPVNENPDADLKDAEGDLCIETEGVGSKYLYRMDLSLRSSGKTAKNNKLVWRGFWSYNKITDDWAEFSRRNEKPLYWSRVKSYGTGA